MADARKQLIDLLEREAFDPVMRASPDGRSDADKRKLAEMQDKTRAEIDRFRGYGSASEVVKNFKRDLSSAPAKKVHRELKALNLPTINDVRERFEAKADELGVDG